MSATTEASPFPARRPARTARAVAAALPAAMLGFTALLDPLVNFGLARGVQFGGVVLESESKTRLAELVMPLFFLASLALAVLAPPRASGRLLRVAAPGIALLVLACLSAVWARAPSQTLTFALYQGILFSSLLLFVCVARDPARVCRWVLAMFAATIAVNLATLVLFPPGPIGHQGIYQYKNTLGSAGGCAFLFGLFHLRAPGLWRPLGWFTAVGALVVTVASDSKTALALMLAAPLLAAGIMLGSRLLRVGPIFATFLLAGLGTFAVLVAAAVAGAGVEDVLLATYGDATFTGRTHIWAFALDYAREVPWLGNGYRGFWSLGLASPKHGSEIEFIRTIGSGHSGFVDIRLDLGLIGLALLVAFIAAAFLAATRFAARPSVRSLLYLSVILFATGRNAMESVILWSSFFDNLAFLLVAFLAAQAERNEPATARSG